MYASSIWVQYRLPAAADLCRRLLFVCSALLMIGLSSMTSRAADAVDVVGSWKAEGTYNMRQISSRVSIGYASSRGVLNLTLPGHGDFIFQTECYWLAGFGTFDDIRCIAKETDEDFILISWSIWINLKAESLATGVIHKGVGKFADWFGHLNMRWDFTSLRTDGKFGGTSTELSGDLKASEQAE